MVISLPEISKRYKTVGGLYLIQSKEMKEAGYFKLGMSTTNIYKRLNSYVNAIPTGFEIRALFLMRIKTKVEKEQVRKAETYCRSLLTPADLQGMRMFPTRVEIFTDPVETIIKALEKTQLIYNPVWFDVLDDSTKIVFDDKLYKVNKILGERQDDVGAFYRVRWEKLPGERRMSVTEERRSVLEGEDSKGKWINTAFKEYLEKQKKSPRSRKK